MMQAGKDYGVEVITAYEFRRVGQVFHPPALLRDRLVKLGLVRRLTEPPAAQTAEEPPQAGDTNRPTSAGRKSVKKAQELFTR